ncbi:MAG TPA: type II secretion system F family protein [Acidimicrobiia bacterium]|nr:type II secretion system F family protein [Acidimicrobiia bacterium]
MTGSGLVLSAAMATSAAVGMLVYVLAPPPKRLTTRVRPYLIPTVRPGQGLDGRGSFARVFMPMFDHAASWLSDLVDRRGPEYTLVRLRQAGWFQDLGESEMLRAYRRTQLRGAVLGTGSGLAVGFLVGLPTVSGLVLGLLGLVVGVTRQRGALETAIDERSELMRIEIYTVNQLLAMRVRAGGGVIHAVSATVSRGQGEVVAELSQALRLHRAGWRASDAFRRIAEITPEPFCSRTYRLLASAEERGSDLASSLLALSEDVRETRREAIKRSATKRRAAMLIPTIAVLAPVLIIFVAAPLPYLITGWQ